MTKILVTTDLSVASKAGVRFALQVASQQQTELIFFHCFQALIPTTVQHHRLETALKRQTKSTLLKLEKFIAGVLRTSRFKPGKYRCAVLEDLSPDSAILQYAQENEVDFICISTRGGGQLLKLMGTHTGRVIERSSIPVMVVPHTYRVKKVESLLYATDLEQVEKELNVVCRTAQNLQAAVDMVHFYYAPDEKQEAETLFPVWQKRFPLLRRMRLEAHQMDDDFAHQMEKNVQKLKPGLVVFFTHPKTNWFNKWFSPNRSESFSYITKVPMLVYRKGAK
ncbi:MAG: universal stress protein [Saprospiraceae bacterium]|nr:universal stress protein [Saprospiraceae bacterium]